MPHHELRRYKYEQEQRRKESRKKATNVVVKEMKFRPKIDEHDYVTKMKHVERFLAEGSKVKLTIMFRGREVFHPELGLRILERAAEQVSEIAIVESAPRQDGRNMTMVLHPIKRPAKARAAARRRHRRERQRRRAVMPKMKTPGRRQAVPGHGVGQDPAPEGVSLASAREEVEPPDSPSRSGRRSPAPTASTSNVCWAGPKRMPTAAHAGGIHDGQGEAFRPRQEAPPRRARESLGLLRREEPRFRKANEQVMRSLRYAYRDRRAQGRVPAALDRPDQRRAGSTTSRTRAVAGLKAADIDVDRKILADLAVHDSAAFGALVAVAREALQAA